jgi:S1-C subfamily serine protease
MKPSRLAAVLIAAALTIGATGCGKFPETIDEITYVAESGPAFSVVSVARPDASLASDAVVADAAHSVVKVSSLAYSCQKVTEGSGFVIAPDRVMTNAHVVAGGDSFTVAVDGQELDAIVVMFDPITDISILNVPGLRARPLDFAHDIALTGTDAVVLGYPGGGPFVAYPARIREVIDIKAPDLYGVLTFRREVYAIRGTVGHGDSGGPLIDRDGRVLGMNFGAAVHDRDIGFVLTAKLIYPHAVGSGTTQPVATGPCIS